MASDKIDSFAGEYSFLSNFYPSDVEWEGVTYPTVEHAFQAAKTLDPDEREQVRAAFDAGQAKRLGRAVTLRDGWDSMKVDIMRDLVRQKFERHSDLRAMLLATGDADLIEGNHWKDSFWGVYQGRGQNHLGKILMAVRAELADDMA